MKQLKNLLILGLCISSFKSHTAFNGISDHSRANCINNESITWDYTDFHLISVVSFHISDYMNRMGQFSKHRLQTGWETTRRSAAVHWGEGKTPSGYYLVQGWHWEFIGGNEILRANTSVDNCSIYDGWWNF